MPDPPEQPDLLAALASRLNAPQVDGGILAPVDPAGRARILRIARDVAHATERQNAPLAAYLIGRFVQESIRSGISEAAALDQAASAVRSLIEESPG